MDAELPSVPVAAIWARAEMPSRCEELDEHL